MINHFLKIPNHNSNISKTPNKNIDIEKSKKNVNVKYIKNPKIFISLCFILFFNKIKRIKIKFIFLYLI